MKYLALILLVVFVSCGKQDEILLGIDSSPSRTVLIESQNANGVDDMNLNLNTILSYNNLDSDSSYSKIVFTLSDFSGGVVVTIEGLASEALSSTDLTNLTNIGIENIDSSSTKSSLVNFQKNPSNDVAKTFNIKVEASIYSDSSFSNQVAQADTAYIYVGGDNHYDGEYLVPVKDENYYLFHEWITNDFAAIQLLPEGNYRKLSLGTTTQVRMDSFVFSTSAPEVNSHQVGYSINRDGTRQVFKVTNDGTGLNGWSHTLMGNIPLPYRLTSTDLVSNGEGVLIGRVRWGSYQDDSFVILEWDGANWNVTKLGEDLKTRLGLSFTNSTTGVSDIRRASDGSYYIAISETSSGWTAWPNYRVTHTSNYLLRLQYNSGDIKDLDNWSYEKIDIPNMNLFNTQESSTQEINFSEYTDKNNFTLFISGQGIAKVVRSSGIVSYIPVATHPDTTTYDTSIDFPTGKDSNNLSQVTECHEMQIDLGDSNKLLCMSYTSMYTINITTGEVEEILGKLDGVESVIFSR